MRLAILVLCFALLLSGNCLAGEIFVTPVPPKQVITATVKLHIPIPVASGRDVRKNNDATIDYSNITDGYIMVKCVKKTSRGLRVIVTTPNKIDYIYPLNQNNEFEVLPLSEGDGSYAIKIYEQMDDSQKSNKYKEILTLSINVKLPDQNTPFLYPNQFVNFNNDSLFLKKAAEFKLIKNNKAAIDAIYNYVVKNVEYDKVRAATDTLDWNIPDLDRIFTELTGVCVDYAALMAAMARSIGIPTKLITGYTGKTCHAWVEVYLEPSGWVRMDPTVEALARIKRNIEQFIADDANYQQLYQF